MYLHTPTLVELCLYSHWVRQPQYPNVRPTMLQTETVIWEYQTLRNLRHHSLMPFSLVKNLIVKDCNGVSDLVRFLATGFPGESGQAPTHPLEAIKYPEPQGDHVLPRLGYLGIDGDSDYGETSSWLKVLLSHRPSLRVAVTSSIARTFTTRFGARFAVVEWEALHSWWYETFQSS